jgi:tetratricopeptide (TPR) repeat protein
MKAKLFFLLLILTSFANAQENSCADKEKQLAQYLIDNDNNEALDLWNTVKVSCPDFSEKIYVLGNKILQYQIEIADSKDKESKVNDLMLFFNQYDKFFPANKNGNYEKRAIALYTYNVGTPQELFSYLDKAFKKEKETFANSQAIYNYFELYLKHYNENSSVISIDELLDKYCAVNQLIVANSSKYPTKKEEYHRVELGLDILMKDFLSVDKIVAYAQKKLESNTVDTSWLEPVARVLSVKCKNQSIFEKVATKLDKINPTSVSAYYLATYNLNIGNQEKAIELFNKSAELAPTKLEKATTYYAIATILSNGDKPTCQKMVLNAIENNPNNGRYYIFLANLYANSIEECASNSNEKNAIFKLASNTALKAITVEPRLKPTAEAMSSEYLKRMIFDDHSKDKSATIGCWIQQKVQF